jgi:hypothetical protein
VAPAGVADVRCARKNRVVDVVEFVEAIEVIAVK